MMWLGGSWRSWMMYSPRSVSTGVTPCCFEIVVERDLLRDHRLALGDDFGVNRAANFQHGGARLGGVACPVHLAASRGDLFLVAFEVMIEMCQRVVLDRLAGVAQRLEFRQALDRLLAAQRKPGARHAERGLQVRVGEADARVGGEVVAGWVHGA